MSEFKVANTYSDNRCRTRRRKGDERGIMVTENSRRMAKAVAEVLEDRKGRDLSIIDISGISVIADYFLIVTAENTRQVDALSEAVQDRMAELHYKIRRAEGMPQSGWILLDYNDIIVHIFDKEQRLFYDLERIWSDGKRVLDLSELEVEGTVGPDVSEDEDRDDDKGRLEDEGEDEDWPEDDEDWSEDEDDEDWSEDEDDDEDWSEDEDEDEDWSEDEDEDEDEDWSDDDDDDDLTEDEDGDEDEDWSEDWSDDDDLTEDEDDDEDQSEDDKQS